MRAVKVLEVGVMAVAAAGFWFQWVPVFAGLRVLMGLHSTLFGPVKYAYLPQHLSERELTGGNGMVEMGTFVAILLGNVGGGLLMSIAGSGTHWVAISCLLVALVGWGTSKAIPESPSADPGLTLNWNPVSETWRNLKLAYDYPSVFRSLLGISWMWFSVRCSCLSSPRLHAMCWGQRASRVLVVGGVLDWHCHWFAVVRNLVSSPCRNRPCACGAVGMTVFAWDLYLATQACACRWCVLERWRIR